MYGWNWLGYELGMALHNAFGFVGIRNISLAKGYTTLQDASRRPIFGWIDTDIMDTHGSVPMQHRHIVADIWVWDMYQPTMYQPKAQS